MPGRHANMDVLRVVKRHPAATLPCRATDGSAGYDLTSSEAAVIPARGQLIVKTGIAACPPHGSYIRIAPRSSLAVKGIDVMAGVVDPDYTRDIGVVLSNNTDEPYPIPAGEAIAQIVLETMRLSTSLKSTP